MYLGISIVVKEEQPLNTLLGSSSIVVPKSTVSRAEQPSKQLVSSLTLEPSSIVKVFKDVQFWNAEPPTVDSLSGSVKEVKPLLVKAS